MEAKPKAFVMDSDYGLLLRQAKMLLNSRNAAYWNMAIGFGKCHILKALFINVLADRCFSSQSKDTY